jgi:hypothetical protein
VSIKKNAVSKDILYTSVITLKNTNYRLKGCILRFPNEYYTYYQIKVDNIQAFGAYNNIILDGDRYSFREQTNEQINENKNYDYFINERYFPDMNSQRYNLIVGLIEKYGVIFLYEQIKSNQVSELTAINTKRQKETPTTAAAGTVSTAAETASTATAPAPPAASTASIATPAPQTAAAPERKVPLLPSTREENEKEDRVEAAIQPFKKLISKELSDNFNPQTAIELFSIMKLPTALIPTDINKLKSLFGQFKYDIGLKMIYNNPIQISAIDNQHIEEFSQTSEGKQFITTYMNNIINKIQQIPRPLGGGIRKTRRYKRYLHRSRKASSKKTK